MFIRRLDRYVLSAFIAPFILISFLIVSLFIIIDLFGRFDEFAKIQNVPLIQSITTYYIYVLPGILSQWLLPIITVIAGLFAVSNLDRHHELTAMLSSGISRQRILTPLLVATLCISVGDYFLKSKLVPYASDKLEIIHDQMMLRSNAGNVFRDLALSKEEKSGYTFVFAQTVYKQEKKLENIVITRMDKGGRWIYHLQAETAQQQRGGWLLKGVRIQKKESTYELPQYHNVMELPTTIKVADLILNRKKPQNLSDTQLHKMAGTGALYIELLVRPVTAMTSFVLFLWSMIILFNSREDSFLVAMGYCVIMVMGYYAFSWVVIQTALHSSLNPLFVLYTPLAFFLGIGGFLYTKMSS